MGNILHPDSDGSDGDDDEGKFLPPEYFTHPSFDEESETIVVDALVPQNAEDQRIDATMTSGRAIKRWQARRRGVFSQSSALSADHDPPIAMTTSLPSIGHNSGKKILRQAPPFRREINVGQFTLIRTVGKGAFGKVELVRRKLSRKYYALKYVNKKDLVAQGLEENVISERTLLEELRHPFIVNLQFAFQDDVYLYFGLEIMLGGDLRFLLDGKMVVFTDAEIRFYFGELILAVEYLHALNIVHRDIKPGNIMLDSTGHVHLADFNLATRLENGRRSFTQCGTYRYTAPEVVFSVKPPDAQGYNRSVDWWSLGMVMYECVFGECAFYANSYEELEAELVRFSTDKIEHCESLSENCIALLTGLLQKNASRRLLFANDIKAHAFFKSYQENDGWELLKKKQIKPPFMPDQSSLNFDPTVEIEELLMEDHPLEQHRQREKSMRATLRKSRKNAHLGKGVKSLKETEKTTSTSNLPAKDKKNIFQRFTTYDSEELCDAEANAQAELLNSFEANALRRKTCSLRVSNDNNRILKAKEVLKGYTSTLGVNSTSKLSEACST